MNSSSSSPESGRFKWYALLFVLLMVGLSALYSWASLNYTYADGERAGYARKLSRRGWLCKTWEGELAMANQPGSQESLWFYTVRDESIIDKIKALEGRQVVLMYRERKGVPSRCFGDTLYHVYDVRPVAGP